MTRPEHRSTYVPHIDGLRALAVLSVIVYHLNERWLPGGFSGVDIFFVISGFVVSASVAEIKKTSPLGFFGYFYARRILRIVPALVVCLVVTHIATMLFVPWAWLSHANERTGFFAFFRLHFEPLISSLKIAILGSKPNCSKSYNFGGVTPVCP